VNTGNKMKKLSLKCTVDQLKKSENLDDIMDVMRASFRDLGFFEWGYMHQILRSYVKSPVFIFINMSKEWIERYLEMGYHEVDPIGKYYPNNNLPWIWNTEDNWSKIDKNAVEFMKDIRRHGYTGGLCLPLFSAQNTRGFINLVTRHPSLEDLYNSLDGPAAQVTLILRYVQEEISRISLKDEENIQKNPLSTRQKEVLLWVGEGLTSKGIGEILGISYRTVESYLEEIQQKLCVSNRQQAVTRAVSLGYVIPQNLYSTGRDPLIKLVLPKNIN
jgi:DNA-binding CsgD family transcriptional regulator